MGKQMQRKASGAPFRIAKKFGMTQVYPLMPLSTLRQKKFPYRVTSVLSERFVINTHAKRVNCFKSISAHKLNPEEMKPFVHPPFSKKNLKRHYLPCFVWFVLLLLYRPATGQTWTTQNSNTGFPLNCVWGLDENNVWIGGNTGIILKYNGTSWAPSTATIGNVLSLWGVDDANIWACAGSSVRKFNGTSWITQATQAGGLFGLWGVDASNIWVVGAASIRKYDGTSWAIQVSGSTVTFRGVWGTDASNIWAVGSGGAIWKYNGSSWTPQTSNTTENLFGVWGTDALNVWAVGANGTILKYNGFTWATQPTFVTNQLNAIWGVDANNIWAVGNSGIILRKSGPVWLQSAPSGQHHIGIWGTGGKVWVAGGTGTILYANTGLPVELTAFQARLQSDHTTLLHWQTATEHNNAGFDIERSTDGKRWEKIGFMPGQGNAQEQRTYQFTDPQPFPGRNYYRLAQLDTDGATTYSDIRSIVLAKDGKPGFRMFPNPVTQGQLTLELSDQPDENATLHIYSGDGQLRLQQPVHSAVHQANLDGWTPGIYLLEVKNAGKTWHEQVVVGN